MINNYSIRPRRKAFLGTAISAIVGIGSSILGASSQKKAQERQYALQRAAENRNVGVQGAANLTEAFVNADEEDRDFRNRFFLYGGRKKAKWGADDTNALINAFGNLGQTAATSIIGQAVQKGFNPTAINPIVNKDEDKAVYDSAGRTDFLNNYYRTAMLRCGGGMKIRRR